MYIINIMNIMVGMFMDYRFILYYIFIFEFCFYVRKLLRFSREVNLGVKFL